MPSEPYSTKKDLSRFLQKQPSIFFAKILPFVLYRQYLSLIGCYYFGINKEERRSVSRSLKYVLGDKIGRFAFSSILVKTYLGIFEHYFEKMMTAHKSLPEMMDYLNSSISFSGKQRMDRIMSENMGCILVSGHFGAVEYIPLFLASNNYRSSMILRFKTKDLRQALVNKSKSVDLELIDADGPNVMFKALNAIKAGRILITLCDEIHSWRPCRKSNAKLFGRRLPKDRTLDILYKRSKAPICFGIVQREKNGYDLAIHSMADGRKDCSACEASWQLLEQYVYRTPEQWYQWPHFYPEFNRYISNMECYDC